jgi:hypothetical protein
MTRPFGRARDEGEAGDTLGAQAREQRGGRLIVRVLRYEAAFEGGFEDGLAQRSPGRDFSINACFSIFCRRQLLPKSSYQYLHLTSVPTLIEY